MLVVKILTCKYVVKNRKCPQFAYTYSKYYTGCTSGHCFHLSLICIWIQFQGYRIFNTWLGDPSKVIFLEEFIRVIERENLLDNVQSVGKQLVQGMTELQVIHALSIMGDFNK